MSCIFINLPIADRHIMQPPICFFTFYVFLKSTFSSLQEPEFSLTNRNANNAKYQYLPCIARSSIYKNLTIVFCKIQIVTKHSSLNPSMVTSNGQSELNMMSLDCSGHHTTHFLIFSDYHHSLKFQKHVWAGNSSSPPSPAAFGKVLSSAFWRESDFPPWPVHSTIAIMGHSLIFILWFDFLLLGAG